MMGLPWFRLYHELQDDPKIGRLSDGAFRTFIECLCIACKAENNGDTGVSPEMADWAFRRPVEQSLKELTTVGVVKLKDGRFFIPKWEERQRPSDSGAERMKRYRDRHRYVTGDVTRDSETSHRDGIEEKRVEGEENRVEKKKAPPATNGAPKTVEEILTAFKIKGLYDGIDVKQEVGRMKAWLLTPKGKGRKLTAKFMVNWLNKCDAPLTGGNGHRVPYSSIPERDPSLPSL